MKEEFAGQIEWLLEGDPAIRWQVMRDLQGLPEAEWAPERARVSEVGWGQRFLDRQDAEGTWGDGIYSPKWTSTTYTLLTLIDCGLSQENRQGKKGAERILDSLKFTADARCLPRIDQCVYGFYLHILAYFKVQHPLVAQIADHVLSLQMPDGGWNCRRDRVKSTRHSSFHTTFNVLDGLWAAEQAGLVDARLFANAEFKAIDFMLQHRMFKSDRTGEIVNEHFTEFSYPPRWHYDVLRGLDYIRLTPYREDSRLSDALDLLRSRGVNGIWPAENKHAGKEHFALESPPRQSRWNTLRALRVLAATAQPMR